MSFPKPLLMAHDVVRGVVRRGEVVVDATLGHGHDALFLAELVGGKGVVYGFDVQEAAVESARGRLLERGYGGDGVRFYCEGHERMGDFVDDGVAAVMFNLGFLPYAENAVITTVETTLPALGVACGLLRKGGVITVMCYPRHAGGDVEAAAVVEWAAGLDFGEWKVMRYGVLNATDDPPFLVALVKVG